MPANVIAHEVFPSVQAVAGCLAGTLRAGWARRFEPFALPDVKQAGRMGAAVIYVSEDAQPSCRPWRAKIAKDFSRRPSNWLA